MARINAALNGGEAEIRAAAEGIDWLACLWRVDACEELTPSCALNGMHLLFLLVARLRARLMPPNHARIGQVLQTPQAEVVAKPVCCLTLRELADAVRNLQQLWKRLIETEKLENLERVLDACMQRFGGLALSTHHAAALDYDDFTDPLPGNLRGVNRAAVRFFSAFFFVAYRQIHLAACATALDSCELPSPVHSHLLHAALDDFYALSMYFDTAIGDVLHYRHEFAGMFHSVTQVMYFHDPNYARRKQLPLAEVHTRAEHFVPLLQQLYPDVRLLREDDTLPPGFAEPGAGAELPSLQQDWAWLVVPGRVYLVSRAGHVFFSASGAPFAALLTRVIK